MSFERSSSEESLPRLGIEMETPPRQLCQNFFTDETKIAKKFYMDSDKNALEKNLQCKKCMNLELNQIKERCQIEEQRWFTRICRLESELT